MGPRPRLAISLLQTRPNRIRALLVDSESLTAYRMAARDASLNGLSRVVDRTVANGLLATLRLHILRGSVVAMNQGERGKCMRMFFAKHDYKLVDIIEA